MDPNIKRITRVARKCVFFGLALLALGLLLLFAFIFKAAPAKFDWATPESIVSLVFVLLGAIFICVRFGVMLDQQQRTITTWWGLLVPFHKTEHSFSRAHFVSLSREKRDIGRGATYQVFPVRLEGAGTDAITIHEPRDYDKARHLAEDVAKFVHLGMRDRSSGEEVAREADALDQSLQQRLRRAGRSVPLAAQPPGARAIFSYGGTRAPTTIEIPPVRLRARWFLQVICVAAFSVFVAKLVSGRADMEIGVQALLLFLGILGIFLLILLHTAILRERLVVSRDELVVTRRDISGTKTTRLTSGEIEEVEVIQAKYPGVFGGGLGRVVIRSDRGSVELGEALSIPGEVSWLSDVLVHVLTSFPVMPEVTPAPDRS